VTHVQVHENVKYLVNVTLVERYHVDSAARTAIDRMQESVSHSVSRFSHIQSQFACTGRSVKVKNPVYFTVHVCRRE